MKRSLLSLIALLCLSGCQSTPTLVRYDAKTYTPAPLRSEEEKAVLENKRYARDTAGQFGYNLHRVDGISVMTFVARDQRVLLNPGRHVVEIEAFGPSGGGKREVSFEATAHGRYETDGRISSDRIEMWIQTIDTQQVVSEVAVLPLFRGLLPAILGK